MTEVTELPPFEYSDPFEVELQWQKFEVYVPIDPERELVKLTFSMHNESQIPGFFDDLEVLKNLMNDKLMASNIIYMPIEEVPAGQSLERIVYGALELSTIVKASYVPEESINGSVESLQLSIKHTTINTTICTKTFLEGTSAQSGLVFDFGPVDKDKADVLAANSVKLVKGTAGKLPRGVLILQWDVI